MSTLAKGGKALFRTGATHHTRLFSATSVSQRSYYCATFVRHLSDSFIAELDYDYTL